MNGPGALAVAFAGGIVSFLSPCTIPLLPGYLSYISGLGAEEIEAGEDTRTLVAAAALFVLGFSLVFVALGASLSYIGTLVLPYKDTLTRVAGVFIILMALAMIGLYRLPILAMEKRFRPGRDFGIWSALPLGMAFAFGWTPCIGPVLTSVLAVATTEKTAEQGALLLFVYALGLGVPFLAVALFAGRLLRAFSPVKRHFRAIESIGGVILLAMGVFLVTNQWTQFMAPVMTWYGQLHLPS